jgi:hypothetical protein
MARSVRLLGVPVDIFLRAANHHDELIREFALISLGDRAGVTIHEVPARLLVLVDLLRDKYARPSSEIRAQVEDGARRGDRTVDLELPANATVARLTDDITDALDAADEFCRSGHLLTLDAPPEVVAWRHWWRDQVVGQIRQGIEPSPFPMPAEA